MLTFKATLRLSSTSISLLDVEDALGKGSGGHSIGDSYSRGRYRRNETIWLLESSAGGNVTIEGLIKDLLGFFNSKQSAMQKIAGDCEVDIVCMLSSDNGQGGFVLSHELMKQLGDNGVSLSFDVYVDDGGE